MRRTINTLAAVALLSSALTAVASAADPLTVWVMGDSGAKFGELVAPFSERTGVVVDVVAIPWDSVDQKLTTAVASGQGPDVVQIGLSKLRTFADAGALMELDPLLGGHPALAADNFADGVAGAATAINGSIVSVPWVSDTRVLFYRSDILAGAGFSEPPKTWDELRDMAKVLAARGEGQYGYYIPQWDNALPIVLTWGQGGSVVDADGNVTFDTPEFATAVDIYAGLYSDGSVPTNGDFDQTQGFISGIAPMLISGPYLAKSVAGAAPELDGKWSAAVVPSAKAGTSLLAGSNMGIWHNTEQSAEALQLLEFLSEPATQVRWYEINGELPTSKAALVDPALNADPLVKVYVQQLNDAKVLPLLPNWDGGVGSDLLQALNSIVLTDADRASTLEGFFASTEGLSVN